MGKASSEGDRYSEILAQASKHFLSLGERLLGLSRSMDLLVEEGGTGAAVSNLVRNQLEPFGKLDGSRISASGPNLFLTRDATQNIGLALHELATNAMKFGALSVPQGIVTVEWELFPGALGSIHMLSHDLA